MVSENYYNYLKRQESGGNPNDQAERSSAYGLYQFTTGTWNDFIKQHPELGLKPEDRTTAVGQEKAIRAFTADNANALRNTGIEDTDLNVHMAHLLGTGDAIKFINAYKANPNASAKDFVQEKSVQANPEVFFNKDGTPKTLGDVYGFYGARFGEAAAPTQGTAPAVAQQGAAPAAPATAPSAATPPQATATPGARPYPTTLQDYLSRDFLGHAPYMPPTGAQLALAGGGRVSEPQYMAGVDPNYPAQEAGPVADTGNYMAGVAIPQRPLPPALAEDPDFVRIWRRLHTEPRTVSHEELAHAYQKATALSEGSAAGPAQPPYTEESNAFPGGVETTYHRTPGAEAQPAPRAVFLPQAPHYARDPVSKLMDYLKGRKSQDYMPYEEDKYAHYAGGGKVHQRETKEGDKSATGYIRSATGGTADALKYKVAKDSYVLPADIVSGLGKGNSDAGARAVERQYKIGKAQGAPRGTVPVRLSGGEYVVPPEIVKKAGHGDIERGVDHFEALIHRVRQRTIQDLHHKRKPIR